MDSSRFADLYSRARQGDRVAQGELTQAFEAQLLHYTHGRFASEIRRIEQPQDIVQDVFQSFCASADKYPGHLDEKTLLRRFERMVRQEIGRKLRRPHVVLREGSLALFDPANPSCSSGPVTKADEREHLERLLSRLKPGYATVLRHCLIEGRSLEETADLLGLTHANVKKRLARARKALFKLIHPEESP
jgi:RNA polymerase sigma factor (sigma-70 family)